MLVDQTRRLGSTLGALRSSLRIDHVALARIAPILAAIFAFIMRAIYLNRSYDLFIDELTYLKLARSVAFDHSLTLSGRPFFLHPPAWLVIEGVFIRLFNVSGSLFTQIYETRFLVAPFAAVSAALVYLIAHRAAGWPAGLAAVLLFSLDPFIIKYNSMNMLETPAMLWILAGYWVVFSGFSPPARPDLRNASRPILAGVFFGLAVLTKEMMFFLTLLPLLVCLRYRWVLPRRVVALIATTTLLVYSLYPLLVVLTGQWGAFVQEKTKGLGRFVGLLRTTGFHRPGGPTLAESAIARLGEYGTTYAVMALGLIALFVLYRQREPTFRLMAIWAGSTYAMLAYSALFGTSEEQFFYYLIVVCVVSCAVAGAIVVRSRTSQQGQQMVLRVALALLVLASVYNGSRWARIHLTPGNGYESVERYLQGHVPGGERVASTSEVGQAVLHGYLSGPWGKWSTVDALVEYKPEYLLVTPHDLEWENKATAQALLSWVSQNGQKVYEFDGPGANQLVLYSLHLGCPNNGEPDGDDVPGQPPDTDGC